MRPMDPHRAGEAPADAPGRPSLLAAVPRQLRLLREPFRRRAQRLRLTAAPRGQGELVVVLPGMGMGDLSTGTLRRYLRRQGFDARGWGLGRQRPEIWITLPRMLARLETLAAERGAALALVGWSLGGVVARELARLRPDLVRCVVTLGAPVVGGLRDTAIAGLFRLQGWDLDDVARRVDAANRVPIRVPVTAIWSRRDGIVDWRAAVDHSTPGAENVEVGSCHWGLGLDPDVLAQVARAVAVPE